MPDILYERVIFTQSTQPLTVNDIKSMKFLESVCEVSSDLTGFTGKCINGDVYYFRVSSDYTNEQNNCLLEKAASIDE
jgi:hypothetical protein